MKMLRLAKYILLIILLLTSSTLAWAEDKDESKESDEELAKAIAEALITIDQAISGNIPDVITLGQMLKDGVIDPIESKSRRDNPFDEWAEPDLKPDFDDGFLGPLPPPMFAPEGEEEAEDVFGIVDGVNLVGIMEVGEKRIAILKYGGRQRSLKTGERFNGPVLLVVTEVGSDYVILSTEDGVESEKLLFSFANPNE